MMRERFTVRPCPEHGLQEHHSMGRCMVHVAALERNWCGKQMGEPFEVMRCVPDLEGAGQSRRTDPATARSAGEIKVNRGSQRWLVLEALREELAGLTAHELELRTGIPYASLTPRIGELKRGGYIIATALTRPSQYGVEQEVLRAVDGAAASYSDPEESIEVEPDPDAVWEQEALL